MSLFIQYFNSFYLTIIIKSQFLFLFLKSNSKLFPISTTLIDYLILNPNCSTKVYLFTIATQLTLILYFFIISLFIKLPFLKSDC